MVCAPRLFFRDIGGRDAGREAEIREGFPDSEGFDGNGKGRETVGAVFLMDSLPNELPGKMGKGTEKRAIEGKGFVRSGVNETNDLYFDRKGKPVSIEEKGTGIQTMPPDAGIRMTKIVMGLKLGDLSMIF